MAQPFLALITPLSSGAHPDHTLPIPPGPVDPGYGVDAGLRPTHPIYNPAYPDNTLPQPPLGIWGPPQMPPGFWGGGMGPGVKPQPPAGAHPSHPIYIPPEGSPPPLGIWGPPDMPPGFWGGGMGPGVKPQPHPEHPIVLPPDLPPETGEGGKITWKTAWTPWTGWVVIGVPAEGTLVPTPSGIGQSPTKGKP